MAFISCIFLDHNQISESHAELESASLDCWTTLYKIQSCSNEIVTYFASGAIDITPPCCKTIALISHQCFPTTLGALGYGTDQADVSREYCDALAWYAAVSGGSRPARAVFGAG